MQVVWMCVGVAVLFFILGLICGFTFCLFGIAKDKTVIRLRDGEVVMQKSDLDALVKAASPNRKRELLQED